MRLDTSNGLRPVLFGGILISSALIFAYFSRGEDVRESGDRPTDQDMVYLGACMDEDRLAVLGRLSQAGVLAVGHSATGATSVLVPRGEIAKARKAIRSDPERNTYDFTFGD